MERTRGWLDGSQDSRFKRSREGGGRRGGNWAAGWREEGEGSEKPGGLDQTSSLPSQVRRSFHSGDFLPTPFNQVLITPQAKSGSRLFGVESEN